MGRMRAAFLGSSSLGKFGRGISRTLSIGRPTLIAGLLLAACNTTDTLPPRLASHLETPEIIGTDMAIATPEAAVLSAGMTRIAEVFFRPIDMRKMSLDGLNALKTLDSDIDFKLDSQELIVTDKGKELQRLAIPVEADAGAWANLTTLALDTARRSSAHLAVIDRELVLETMFDAMMSNLDRFSRYASASAGSRERSMREGFGGVGMAFEHQNGEFVIRSIFPEGPAANAGLEVGDQIVSVDGKGVDDLDLTQVRDLLRGRVGSFVMVDVKRAGKLLTDRSLLRERVIANTVVARIDDGVGFITIERFNAATTAHVRSAIAMIRQRLGNDFRGLVLDMRDNPGGLLEQAVSVADLFMTKGRIIRTAGRHPESFQNFAADELDVLDGAPLVVMVNGGSASAAEVVGAALQESGRAIVVGTASYGKGSVQTVTRLPNDGELFVTWSEIFTPEGHGLHEIGILPNICIHHSFSTEADDRLLALIASHGQSTPSIWKHQELHVSPTSGRPGALQSVAASFPSYAEIAAEGRQACPGGNDDPEQDARIAKLLISRPALIAQLSGTATARFASNSSDILQAASATEIGKLK
jgi:carboxyl-terminal processing protease